MPNSRDGQELLVLAFERQQDWADWLEEHHSTSPGIWLRLAKKAARIPSVSYDEAVEIALCYGWIDGQAKGDDEAWWRQKFTRRRAKSVWSRINRDRAEALIRSGRMRPAGLEAVEAARQDGRWDAAYEAPSTATVPPDLQAELDNNEQARAFFDTLNSANRYAILWRIQTAKKPETRARRIQQFVEMLARNETLH